MGPAESVKNLAVIMDAEYSMQRHVAYVTTISRNYEGFVGILIMKQL